MYYANYKFSVDFLKFLSFFLSAKFGPTTWNSPFRFFFFSKCLPFNFSGKLDLKTLLQLSQKIATVVACQIFRFPERFEYAF